MSWKMESPKAAKEIRMRRDHIAKRASRWHRSACGIVLCAGLVAVRPAAADDFIRGDANNDGIVTLSDGHSLMRSLFHTGQILCGDAADVDNNGEISLLDALGLINHVILGRAPPASPFPEAGPDDGFEEEIDTRWPCDDYGVGEPLDDPPARLWIVDAIAPGGADGRVAVRLAMANGTRAVGYYAEVDGGGIFAPRTGDENDGVFDLSGAYADGLLGVTEGTGGVLRVGFVGSLWSDVAIPPGDGTEVLEIQLCLAPGTPAGTYPISLGAAEIIDFDSGRRILPEIAGGTLTVLEDVTAADCQVSSSTPPRTTSLNVTFKLEDSAGFRGSVVTMPFVVRVSAHARADGFQFSIDFDEGVLQLLSAQPALQRPDGNPWFTYLTIDNRDTTPGNAGVDEGYAAGYYIYSHGLNIHFPIDEEFVALNLHFLVREDAPFGSTDVRFVEEGILCYDEARCYPVRNTIQTGGWQLPPSLVDSFALVNGLLNIIPDTTPFVRGDANSDDLVNISDPQFTLGYLFLGTDPPSCFDAADSNDDGVVNIADPIDTLGFLFAGTHSSLPPPHGSAGPDPTRDDLLCLPRGP
jgi:hypothetical protein